MLAQAVDGLVDLALHGPNPATGAEDARALVARLHPLPPPDDLLGHARFGHLVGYGGSYYAYAYADVAAADAWRALGFGANPVDPRAGAAFGAALAAGCAEDPVEWVEGWLGGRRGPAAGAGWAPDDEAGPPPSPALPFTVATLEPRLRAMYKAVTEGKFADGLAVADDLLHRIPLVAAADRREGDEVKELLTIAREYNVGLRCELARKEAAAAGDAGKAAALAAYFTRAKLQPAHAALALRSAMVTHYKLGNLATAAGFCRRWLEGGAPAKIGAQARQVLAACERAEADAAPVDYDDRNPFDLCSITWTPIYR
jgi:hypothetical protein